MLWKTRVLTSAPPCTTRESLASQLWRGSVGSLAQGLSGRFKDEFSVGNLRGSSLLVRGGQWTCSRYWEEQVGNSEAASGAVIGQHWPRRSSSTAAPARHRQPLPCWFPFSTWMAPSPVRPLLPPPWLSAAGWAEPSGRSLAAEARTHCSAVPPCLAEVPSSLGKNCRDPGSFSHFPGAEAGRWLAGARRGLRSEDLECSVSYRPQE